MLRCHGLLVVALGAAACTHQRGPADVPGLLGKQVQIETYDHVELTATVVTTPDGIAFRTPDGTTLGFGALESVTEVDHVVGGLQGLAIGGGAGIVIGALAGYASGDDTCDTDQCVLEMTARDKAALGALVLGALAGGIGLVVGGVRGAHDVYSQGEDPVIRPIGPPGSVAGLTVGF